MYSHRIDSNSLQTFIQIWHLNHVRRIGIILVAWFYLAAAIAHAAHTEVQLILSANPARPGDTIWVGVDLQMEPGWHTYWKNPGAARHQPAKIEWELPPGVRPGDIQWPLPEKLPPVEVTTYGYNDEVMLLVPLKLDAGLNPGPLDLKAKVSWLECKEQCGSDCPAARMLPSLLMSAQGPNLPDDAATIELWKSKTPPNQWPRSLQCQLG